MSRFVLSLIVFPLGFFPSTPVQSQPYAIEKAVVANGGGASAAGTYAITATIGQAAAGEGLSGSPFSLSTGFWAAEPSAPTAAGVFIEGRVMGGDRGLLGAYVVVTQPDGTTRATRSNNFGRFRIENLAPGQTVIVEVRSRRYQFVPISLTLVESLSELRLTAIE